MDLVTQTSQNDPTMFTASAPTTSPLPSLSTRRRAAFITASDPEPAPALAPPSIPVECLESADAARPGDTVLVTTDVVDEVGTPMYRILDRFIRTDDDAFRWVANVGYGQKPAVSLVATRVWPA